MHPDMQYEGDSEVVPPASSKEKITRYVGADMVEMIEHYATQQGYANMAFEFYGPLFKPEGKYLGNYSLGTRVWYVRISLGGRFHWAYADSFTDCAWKAHQKICELLESA